MEKDLNVLEKNLRYKFKDIKYLKIALTHSSFANETKEKTKSNERLEFLGDAVLSIIVSDYLFANCPQMPEGDLTKLRSTLVCEKSLCNFSKNLCVGNFLKLSKGETNAKGNQRPSILADAFEAIIAAIYLDSGIEKAREFVLRFVLPVIENPKSIQFKDYKTILQEIIQQNKEEKLQYALVKEIGPDHDKKFEIEVLLNNNIIGKGCAKSKKEAEQQAAKQALALLGY